MQKSYLLLLLDMVNSVTHSNRPGIGKDRPMDQRATNLTRRTDSITRFLGQDETMKKKRPGSFREEGGLRV